IERFDLINLALPGGIMLRQAASHVVQGGRQAADLVPGVTGYLDRALTSGQAVGRLSQAVEPVAQPAPEGDAEHAGYTQAEYSDDDQGADDHSGEVLEVWVQRDEGKPHRSKDQHRQNDQREHEY